MNENQKKNKEKMRKREEISTKRNRERTELRKKVKNGELNPEEVNPLILKREKKILQKIKIQAQGCMSILEKKS